MLTIEPDKTPTKDLHEFLLGSISPRPIAFVSSIDAKGNPNLAPYSFFNCFSSNPPILVFSSNRRVANNTTKDTLANAYATKEVVVNVVNYAIVRQMAIASVEFDSETNEFEKSGLTPIPSDLVKPFRVKESPVQMECRVREVIPLGDKGGAGHLIICDVLRLHVSKDIIDENNRINPHKIDLVGRMGRSYYVRASGDAIHTIVQAVTEIVIGFDGLPASARNSQVLTGNNLGQLAGIKALPKEEEYLSIKNDKEVQKIMLSKEPLQGLHLLAKKFLDEQDDRSSAAKLIMLADSLKF